MLRTINITDRRSVNRFANSALIAIGVAAGWIGCTAFAAEPVSGMRSLRLAYDDVAAPANENGNASTSTLQSSSFTLPPVIDIDAAVATRLPVRLSRGTDELPLGTCLRVVGLPAGASLSGGQANPGKGWIVPLWALDDLKIRLPPEAASGEADLLVSLIDNHDEVIDVQATRLRIKPPIRSAPASSDQDAAPSGTAEPSVADQKKAVAEAPSSSATTTTTKTSPSTSKQLPDRPFELTSSDFRAAGHNGVSLVKQTGLRENHRHTTGVAVADRYSTDFVMVNDLTNGLAAYSLATNPDLQVYPTPGTGDLTAIRDVLTLPSTDFAIVSIPVMNKLRSSKVYGDIGEQLALIGPLLTEELHVLALAHIHDVKDLAGQTVSLGPKGSLAATLGHDILNALDVKATEVNLDFDAAFHGMRAGKVSAILLISGKPVRHLAERTAATSGFHHDEVIDVQTIRLRIKPPIRPAPASSDQDAAPSATAEPSVADQKKAVAEAPSSSPTSTTTETSTSTSKQSPDHRPFELTSSDFRAAGHKDVSLVKQTGLRENHRHTTGIAVADRYSTDFVMVNDLTNGLADEVGRDVLPITGSALRRALRDVSGGRPRFKRMGGLPRRSCYITI